MKTLRGWLQEVLGHTVFVWWEGDVYKHTSWGRAEALAWVGAYPRGCVARVYAGMMLVAERRG